MKLIADTVDIERIEKRFDDCCNVSSLNAFPGETIITPIATAVPIKVDPIKYNLRFLWLLLSINNTNNNAIPNDPACKAAYDSDNPAEKKDTKNRKMSFIWVFSSIFLWENIIRIK